MYIRKVYNRYDVKFKNIKSSCSEITGKSVFQTVLGSYIIGKKIECLIVEYNYISYKIWVMRDAKASL